MIIYIFNLIIKFFLVIYWCLQSKIKMHHFRSDISLRFLKILLEYNVYEHNYIKSRREFWANGPLYTMGHLKVCIELWTYSDDMKIDKSVEKCYQTLKLTNSH